MTATATRRPWTTRTPDRAVSAQNIKEMLTELAYRLHATKVVGRVPPVADRGLNHRPTQPR
jgi:hypothetical protein